MTRGYWLYGLVGVAAFLSGWVLFAELPEWGPTRGTLPAIDASNSQIVEGALTEATLFYVSDDGMRLVGFSRSLERLAEPTAQARAILEAQLAPPPPPLLSPIPTGTRLRALYLTDRGDAFVDLSEEITLGHSGMGAIGHSGLSRFRHTGIRTFVHSGIRAFGHSGIRSFGHSSIGHSVIWTFEHLDICIVQ